MTDTPNPLHDTVFMEAFLDLVIPPSADGRMPGAGSLGLAVSVGKSIEADRRIGPLVAQRLQSVQEAALACNPAGLAGLPNSDRADILAELEATDGMLMMAVARHLYPAYYQDPRVLAALGEPPRPPFPEGFEVEPFDPQLLAKLHNRRRA